MRPKKELNIQVGANIQTARSKAGYTQEQMSELIGVTPNHLSAIERGVSGASLENIQKICKLLGISADHLIFGERQADDFATGLAEQLSKVDPEYRPQVQKVLSALLEVVNTKKNDKNKDNKDG